VRIHHAERDDYDADSLSHFEKLRGRVIVDLTLRVRIHHAERDDYDADSLSHFEKLRGASS